VVSSDQVITNVISELRSGSHFRIEKVVRDEMANGGVRNKQI